jgi:uncharacterized protein (DUF1697 family)
MTTCVAFLAGINLGRRRVKGPQLAAPFSELGFTDVATFLASGNVIFSTGDPVGAELEGRIGDQLASGLGFEVRVFLRDADAVREVAAHEPFAPEVVTASAGKLQVGLLTSEPAAADRDRALAASTPDDQLHIRGSELYWLPNGGVSQSALDFGALDRALGPMTIRTMNTVQRIVRRFL